RYRRPAAHERNRLLSSQQAREALVLELLLQVRQGLGAVAGYPREGVARVDAHLEAGLLTPHGVTGVKVLEQRLNLRLLVSQALRDVVAGEVAPSELLEALVVQGLEVRGGAELDLHHPVVGRNFR